MTPCEFAATMRADHRLCSDALGAERTSNPIVVAIIVSTRTQSEENSKHRQRRDEQRQDAPWAGPVEADRVVSGGGCGKNPTKNGHGRDAEYDDFLKTEHLHQSSVPPALTRQSCPAPLDASQFFGRDRGGGRIAARQSEVSLAQSELARR